MLALTLVHIIGGSAALVSGGAALSLRKGGRGHGRAGTVFFGGMLTLTGTGAVMAALAPERGTMMIGLFTAYLVVTSWGAARNHDGEAGPAERISLAVAIGCALALLSFGLLGAASANGRFDSLPAAVHFPFAAIAGLAAVLDLNFILRGRLNRAQRIGRHLWRMCTALLIAAFSFFLGQQKVMPMAIQGSPWLFVPPLATLGAMVFWIFRVRFSRAWGGRPRQSAAPITAEPVCA